MDFLETLNEEQKAAATFSGKHALVLAGAGTGKTRTIIARAIYLLSQGVPASQILILSFTRKSAREIVERIRSYQPQGVPLNLSGQTFHSWCISIIKNNPHIFQQSDYTLIDAEDAENLFKILFTQKYKNNKTIDKKLYTNISSVYSYTINTKKPVEESIKRIICNNMSETSTEDYIKEYKDIYIEIMKSYIEYKKKNKIFDYDDLLYITANGLQQNKEARDYISSRYTHILVDEFQDTNPLQYQLLESFYEKSHLFCVGDDAQSIYAFREADFKTIHNFINLVPDSERLYLNTNYRSTAEILNLSNWLLNQSVYDYSKELKAIRGSGEKPVMEFSYDDYSEANLVTDKILSYFMEKNITYGGHLVLSRSLFGLRQVEGACVVKKIPYVIFGGSSLMKSRHVRDVLSIMRIVANFRDELAWNRYLQLFHKIGPTTAVRLTEEAVNCENILEAIDTIRKKPYDELITKVLEESIQYINIPQEMIEHILLLMDKRFEEIYKEEWQSWRKQEFLVLEEIAKNADSVSDFIAEYILDPSIETMVTSGGEEDDYVILSTIHSAKGLEADICHILNVTPYTYPSKRALIDGEESMEEERRCLYVALTRAKDELILYGRYQPTIRYGLLDMVGESYYFFNEVTEDLLDIKGMGNKNNYDNRFYSGKKIDVDIDLF